MDGLPAARGWAGWVVFAGVLLILLAVFHVVEAVVALSGRADDAALVGVDPMVWGWAQVVLGLFLGLVGLGLLAGRPVARVLGVVVAGVSAVANLGFTAASPGGSVIIIAVDVLVIYAITVHGGELRAPSY